MPIECCNKLSQAWTRYKKVLSDVGEKIDGTHSVARRVMWFVLGLMVTAIAAFALFAFVYGWMHPQTDWGTFSIISTGCTAFVIGYIALLVLGVRILACAVRYEAVKNLQPPQPQPGEL